MQNYPFFSDQTAMETDLSLDRSAIEMFCFEPCGGDGELILEMVELYLQSLGDLTRTLTNSLQDEDLPLLKRTAHSLKSSSRIFGAEGLARECQQLEDLAETAQTASAPQLIHNIGRQASQMETVLPAVVQEMLGRE